MSSSLSSSARLETFACLAVELALEEEGVFLFLEAGALPLLVEEAAVATWLVAPANQSGSRRGLFVLPAFSLLVL